MKVKILSEDELKTYAVILQSGEEVSENILKFVKQEAIKAAQFTAIGAVSGATLGFFDFTIKDYKKIEVNEQCEVLMLAGDVSLFNNEPRVHGHMILGKSDGTAHGGHLLKATVHPTLEIILTEAPSFLERKMDPATGLPLINV
jgi:hypothetical protein